MRARRRGNCHAYRPPHARAPERLKRAALSGLVAVVLLAPGHIRADEVEPALPAYLQDGRFWSHPVGGGAAAPKTHNTPASAAASAQTRVGEPEPAQPAAPVPANAPTATSVAPDPISRDTALARCLNAHDWSRSPWTTCGTSPIPLTERSQVPDLLLGRPSAVINAWNGAALGPKRMYFHGGGHHDYGGNEVIGFNYHDLTWDFRIALDLVPSGRTAADYPPEAFAQDIYPSGGPGATHTYDGIVYAPTTGEVFRFGGVGYWPHGVRPDNLAHNRVFAFDARAAQPRWKYIGALPPRLGADGPSVKSRFDPRTGWIMVRGRHGEAAFDPVTRTWSPTASWSTFESQGSVGNDPQGAVVWYADSTQMWVETQGRKAVAAGPYDARDPFCSKQGMAWHPGRRVLVVWCGNAEVRTWDPDTGRWESYRPVGDAAETPSVGKSQGVLSKWVYLPDYNAFMGYNNTKQGVWFFRLPDRAHPDPERARLANQGFACADGVLNWDCPDLQAALGSGRKLETGVYRSGVVIDHAGTYDFAGSRLARAIRGKAAVIVRGEGVTLRNLSCRGIQTSSGNGACVRQQSRTLRIENARMSDGQSFLLGNPEMRALKVDGLEIAEVGGDCRQKCGRAHGIYYNANQGELTVRNARLSRARDAAHLIKSGAAVTRIEDTVLDEREGAGSRAIDAYNGGHLILRNVTIHARGDDGNSEIIGWNYEQRAQHAANRITFDNVTIHCDQRSRLLGFRAGNAPALENAESISWPKGQCM